MRVEGIARCIVFPDAERALASALSGQEISHCVLMRLRNGCVYFLRSRGHAWLGTRLSLAAAFLQSVADTPLGYVNLGHRLAHVLGISNVEVFHTLSKGVEESQWSIRSTVRALSGRSTHARKVSEGKAAYELSVKQDVTNLRASVSEFVGDMDEQVLQLASINGLTFLPIYNYLIDEKHRRYRLQFASTFPLLLKSVATAEPGSIEAEVRLALDLGIPIVRNLASRWKISQSALRSILGLKCEAVGTGWTDNPRLLVRILNGLPPEYRPKENRESWRSFGYSVGLAERIFRQRVWPNPAGIVWLRHVAREGWRGCDSGEADWVVGIDALAVFDKFRRALVEALEFELSERGIANSAESAAAVEAVVAKSLARMTPEQLGTLAERFGSEFTLMVRKLALEVGVLSGTHFWPLLSENFVSSDRTRIAESLTSREQLRRHGARLEICLASLCLEDYSASCARGDSFIVALSDTASGAACSTAQIGVDRSPENPDYHLYLRQHTSSRNGVPSTSCSRAVNEILAGSNQDDRQRHLRRGFDLLQYRSEQGDVRARNKARLLPTDVALRNILGEATYANLIRTALAEVRKFTSEVGRSG